MSNTTFPEYSCLYEAEGDFPLLPNVGIVILVLNIQFFIVYLTFYRLRAKERQIPERDSTLKPMYGYPTAFLILLFATLGCLLSLPNLVFHLIFYNVNKEISCNFLLNGIGNILWGSFFTLFIWLMLYFLNGRQTQVEKIVSDIEIQGHETFAVLSAGLGAYAIPLAMRFQGYSGKVIALDNWESSHASAWLRENALRSGLDDRVLDIVTQSIDFCNLPFQNEVLDAVFMGNLGMRVTRGMRNVDLDVLRERMGPILGEAFRVLKPRGRLYFSDRYAEDICKLLMENGLPEPIKGENKAYFFIFPTQLRHLAKPTEGMAEGSSINSSKGIAELTPETVRPSRGLNEHALAIVALTTLILVLLWVGLLYLAYAEWESMRLPAGYLYQVQIGNIVTSSAAVFPLILWGWYLRVCAMIGIGASAGHVKDQSIRMMVGVLLGLTFWQAIFWLPSFVIAIILGKNTSNTVFTIVSIATYMILGHVGRLLYKKLVTLWYRFWGPGPTREVEAERGMAEESVQSSLRQPLLAQEGRGSRV